MSRSYHTTRRTLKETEARLKSNADEAARVRSIERIKEELRKKRNTKSHVRHFRKGGAVDPPHTPIDCIAIDIEKDSPFLHYPVNADDLRALLARLPAGVADGLKRIRLCLGSEHQITPEENTVCEPLEGDPFTGRVGYQLLPSIYSGECLGIYFPAHDEIWIHGFVYPPDLPHRNLFEAWLRLFFLNTFIHEVAHHYDFTFRIARGRWRGDNRDNVEIYAENIQYQWMSDFVIPFLRETYRDSTQTLENWLDSKIGIHVPLNLLTGDPRSTGKNGSIRMGVIFNTSEAFFDFVKNIDDGMDINSARLVLADDLHMSTQYDLALAIIDRLVADNHNPIKTLTLRADIYNHQERYEEAIATADQALALDPAYGDAIYVQIDSYEGLQNWLKVIDLADKLLGLVEIKDYQYPHTLHSKANALLELNQSTDAEPIIVELENGKRLEQRLAKRLREKIS